METKKSYGEQNDLNLKALVILSRCFQSVQKREMKTIKQGELTAAQFRVLEILYHKGELRICEIIEGTLSSGGNMTVVIENLEKNGFIGRYPDPHDGRVTLVHITAKGEALMQSLFPNHVDNVSAIFNVLTVQEKYELMDLLKKLGLGA